MKLPGSLLRSFCCLAIAVAAVGSAVPASAQKESSYNRYDDDDDNERDEYSSRRARTGPFQRSNFAHDRAITALGISFTRPQLNDGYEADAPWKGVYYRNHHLEFTTAAGTVRQTGAALTDAPIRASYFSLGAHFESGYRWGNRRYGVRGVLLQPHIGIGIGAFSSGSKSKVGPYINPGFNIELPYCLADFNVNIGYYFGEEETDYAGTRGLRIMPTLNLAVDALWDVLDPKLTFQGIRTGTVYSVQDRTVFSRQESDSRGNWRTVNYTRSTLVAESFQYEAYTNEIPKLSGIFLRYSYNSQRPYRDASRMFGLGYGLRKKMLVLDVYGEYGQLSSVSSLDEKWFKDREDVPSFAPDKEDAGKLRATANSYRAMVKLGFNVFGALYHEDENSFSRWVLGLMGGYQGFNDITPASTTFESDLNALYTNNPDYIKGSYHDVRASENGFAWGFFLGLEIGNVALHWEWPKSKQAPLFTSTNFSIQYLFPVKLIRKKLREAE